MVDEGSVGITEFANDAAPISGILRHRYSDFIVNEIDMQMRVARLAEEDLFAKESSAASERIVHSFDNEEAIQACVKQFSELAGSDHGSALSTLLETLRQRVRTLILMVVESQKGSSVT